MNYEDPNINIAIPVFTIHGNHDDPGGEANLCAVDLLAMSGFVNYFGKVNDLTHVDLCPILLRKGNCKLALYGMGNIRDERLNRMFRHGKIQVSTPVGSTDWFKLLILHQNR